MATKKSTKATADKKEVVTKEEAQVPAIAADLAGLSGQGFEDTDKDAFAIPFLRILQSNSPQVNEDEVSYIEGSKPGMLFNTITGTLYGKETQIVPVHYMRDFVEWLPNRGGFVKSHGSDPGILENIVEVDDKNNQLLENGNIIQDCRNHYVLIADRLEEGPIILSLSSSGIKHSRKWMTLMNALRIPGTDQQAPMFAGVWDIATVLNENDDGKWYQVGNKQATLISFADWVNKEQLDAAQEARKLITSGRARADYDSTIDKEGDNQKTKDKVPF